MCVAGFFGASHGDTCQHVVNVVHQNYINNDDNSDNSNEPHGIQKRFFCNGFTGCRSSNAGWQLKDEESLKKIEQLIKRKRVWLWSFISKRFKK